MIRKIAGKPSHGSVDLWPVLDGYTIDQGILRTTSDRIVQIYRPLDFPELPLDFAYIQDEDTLISFAHKWGELGYSLIPGSSFE